MDRSGNTFPFFKARLEPYFKKKTFRKMMIFKHDWVPSYLGRKQLKILIKYTNFKASYRTRE